MANTNVQSSFNLFLHSSLPYFDTSLEAQRAINLFRYRANLFDMYPVAELNYQDAVGASAETGLPESLDMTVRFVDTPTDTKKEENKEVMMVLKEVQGEKNRDQDSMNVQLILDLISVYYRKSLPKKKSYKDKISNIVKEIVTEDFGLTSEQMYIHTTADTNAYHVRGNLNTEDFLRNLQKQSYCNDYPTSPYLCFFDFYGKFYFAPMEYFFNTPSVATFTIKRSTEVGFDPTLMKGYRFFSGDLDENLYKYKCNINTIDDTGSYLEVKTKLQTFFPSSNNPDKFYVMKNFVEDKIFNNDDYGLIDENEEYLFKGRRNYNYLDSLLTNRFDLIANFDFKHNIGKMVTINMPKMNGEFGTFHSGKYLIIDYSLFYNNQSGIPYVGLTVAKAGRNIERDTFFYGKTI